MSGNEMKRPWWLFSIPKLYLVTGTPLLGGSLVVELDVMRLLCGLFAALTVLAACMAVMQAWLAKRLYRRRLHEYQQQNGGACHRD